MRSPQMSRMALLLASQDSNLLSPCVFESQPTYTGAVTDLVSPEVKSLEEAVWQGVFAEL